MGCCSSDFKKFDKIESPKVEKLIQEAERSLSFWRKKLKYQIISIENIDFSLGIDHLDLLSYTLQYPKNGATASFMRSLAIKNLLTVRMLKYLAILLSLSNNVEKDYLLNSEEKDEYLKSISLLFEISINTLPLNLKILDVTVFKYSELLQASKDYCLEKLKILSLDQIKSEIGQLDLTSKGLRLFLYSEYLKNKASLDIMRKRSRKKQSASNYSQKIFDDEREKDPSFKSFRESPSSVTSGDKDLGFSIKTDLCLNLQESEITPRDSCISDRQSTAPFSHSLAQYSKRMSEVTKRYSFSGTPSHSPSKSDSRTGDEKEGIDFLEKLKGIRSPGQKTPSEESPVRHSRRSMTGLNPIIISKVIVKKAQKTNS